MKKMGTWWNDRSIELVEVSGIVYALNGWNGEKYTDCWQCCGEYFNKSSPESYTLTPIFRFEAEGIRLDDLEENSDEWDRALETVDFSIYRN